MKKYLSNQAKSFFENIELKRLIMNKLIFPNIAHLTSHIYLLLNLILLVFACKTETATPIFKKPVLETVSVFSIGQGTGEARIDITNVVQALTETGVVWSEKNNPTVSDNKVSIPDINEDKLISFDLPNLQKDKTYFVRSFYKNGNEIVYGNELALLHNFTGEWRRLESPTLSPDEYMYAGDVDLGLSGDLLHCYKVNSFSNFGIVQNYFADFGQWNPNFWGNRNQNTTPSPIIFNPIRAGFINNSGTPLTLYGAGHTLQSRGSRFYTKIMHILESNGNWASYQGADAPTTSFGIGKLVYVLENLPNGKLWVFDYGDLSWKSIGIFPYTKAANYIGFDIGERFFMLVEPINNQANSNEFYEYLVNENKWVRRSDFVGANRRNGASFIINSQRLFYGLGKDPSKGNGLRDIFEYDLQKNIWKKSVEYPGGGTVDVVAAGSFDRAYIGFGKRVKATEVGGEDYTTATDFWYFKPKN